MNTSGHHLTPPSASRLSGFGLAVGIHVLVAIGFASVFVVQQPKPPAAPPKVTLVDEQTLPRLPMPKPKVAEPTFIVPTTDPIPTPELPTNSLRPDSSVVPDDGLKRDLLPPLPPVTQQPPARTTTGPQAAGAVCTKMIAPVMPNVNGSGEALFRVTAATQAGRVTSLDIQALRSSMDGRSLRAFKSSIETALRQGYECPGNVSFVQEFQFRLD